MQRFLTLFIMSCLVGFSARLGYQMARPPVLPRFAAELGAEAWLIGLIVGASTLGVLLWVPLVMAMVGKPLAGRLSDRIGRKPVILVGLSLCIVMLPLMPLTPHVVGLLVEGAVFGLGMAILTPSTMALVTDLCKVGYYGAALDVFGTIWDIGGALGPILAGRVIDASDGLQVSTAYLAAFSIVAVVLVAAGVIFSMTVQEPEIAAEKAL
jgi:MFS family permease